LREVDKTQQEKRCCGVSRGVIEYINEADRGREKRPRRGKVGCCEKLVEKEKCSEKRITRGGGPGGRESPQTFQGAWVIREERRDTEKRLVIAKWSNYFTRK